MSLLHHAPKTKIPKSSWNIPKQQKSQAVLDHCSTLKHILGVRVALARGAGPPLSDHDLEVVRTEATEWFTQHVEPYCHRSSKQKWKSKVSNPPETELKKSRRKGGKGGGRARGRKAEGEPVENKDLPSFQEGSVAQHFLNGLRLPGDTDLPEREAQELRILQQAQLLGTPRTH